MVEAMRVPILATARLQIRPFQLDDLADVHRVLDQEIDAVPVGPLAEAALFQRQAWLQWTVLAYDQLARLNQPPYGDRAVVLADSGELVGACGYTPDLNRFGQLPSFGGRRDGLSIPAIGLYWAIAPQHQRQGYATEAAQALVAYAFGHLRLRQILATTHTTNLASQAVMRKLGMRLEHNPFADPPWLQVVGILDHPDWTVPTTD